MNSEKIRSLNERTESISDTSTTIPVANIPADLSSEIVIPRADSSTSPMIMSCPSLPKRKAKAFPIPLAPPVITTLL